MLDSSNTNLFYIVVVSCCLNKHDNVCNLDVNTKILFKGYVTCVFSCDRYFAFLSMLLFRDLAVSSNLSFVNVTFFVNLQLVNITFCELTFCQCSFFVNLQLDIFQSYLSSVLGWAN